MISCIHSAGELKSISDPNIPVGERRSLEVGWGSSSNRQLSLRIRRSRSVAAGIRCNLERSDEEIDASRRGMSGSRREVLLVPALAVGVNCFFSMVAAKAEEKPPVSEASSSALQEEKTEKKEEKEKAEAEMAYRVYDATAIGEPQALGKDKSKVWEKLMGARIVYLGEAEQVPEKDDRILELEIVKNLRNRCFEHQRPISVALEAFPSNLQERLDLFMEKRIDGEALRSYTSHWPPQQWQEYEPLLNYCRDNGIRLVACGTPLEVLRTVQAEGIRGLSKSQRKLYAPPAGSGFISGFSSTSGRSSMDVISSNQFVPFDPCSYLSAQSKVVDDYSMSQIILQSVTDGDSQGMLVVITGASHVIYGSRGIGIPARISKKKQKKNQAVILLHPERQYIRREGEVPVADFLWYSPAKTCTRNCFDRAEIARIMNAAGRRRDALPQDLQKGLDLGLVSPEILQNFFDLEQYPVIAELIHRFQGFRERLLVDPKFLNRLAIEEAISITTTLLAQYERRKGRFFEEIDYVLTDTIRGSVVDFFTVWLPAPTISFLSYANGNSLPENLGVLKNLLGSIPDNAFQKAPTGVNWNLNERFASVIFGGLKLSGVGFISSIGAGAISSALYIVRKSLNPSLAENRMKKKASVLKSALVYGSFLGTSANLRYQIIAGLVEHRLSDYLLSNYNEPLLVNLLSFVVRTINSYWGTQQWIDLARLTGLQPRKEAIESAAVPSLQDGMTSRGSDALEPPSLMECSSTSATSIEERSNQSSDSP